jgi:sugar-specific transcriptional regulator TrmB
MNTELLKNIGLTDSQARSYAELVTSKTLTPPQLAKVTGESRTAAYMALAKLEEIGLAEQDTTIKKQTYKATSPSNLDTYMQAKRQELGNIEEQYRAGLSEMLKQYYEASQETGVQYFRGKEGLRGMYEEHLRAGKDIYLLRTYADEYFFEDFLYDYMEERTKAGIRTYALMPRDLRSINFDKRNPHLNREITWYDPAAYTAPVEVSTFGDKVSIISFGDEAVGTMLESPQIAEAFRQLLTMAKKGAQVSSSS